MHITRLGWLGAGLTCFTTVAIAQTHDHGVARLGTVEFKVERAKAFTASACGYFFHG